MTLLIGVLCLALFDPAWADTMYVSARSAQVRSGKTSLDQVVAHVKLGEAVEVLKRDGRWLNVRTAQGAAGWLFENSLSASKPAGGESDLAALGRNFRGSDATKVSASAGARGLDKASEGYANRSGITPEQRAAVDRMTAYKISDEEMQAFLKAGRLGEYAE
jgi:hypothetical protein